MGRVLRLPHGGAKLFGQALQSGAIHSDACVLHARQEPSQRNLHLSEQRVDVLVFQAFLNDLRDVMYCPSLGSESVEFLLTSAIKGQLPGIVLVVQRATEKPCRDVLERVGTSPGAV